VCLAAGGGGVRVRMPELRAGFSHRATLRPTPDCGHVREPTWLLEASVRQKRGTPRPTGAPLGPTRPLPQPVSRPGDRDPAAGGAALSRLALAPPVGLGLDSMSRASRYTLFPPGRAGVGSPARAQPVPSASPLGGAWWGKAQRPFERVAAPMGGRKQWPGNLTPPLGEMAPALRGATGYQPP
jgi:hypothetical protein